MSRLRFGGTVLLVLMLLAAGCGDDDESGSNTTTPMAAPAADGDADEPSDEAADPGNVGDLPTVLSSNECFAAATALGSAFSGGMTPSGTFDPGGIEDAFDRLSQVAPSEIQQDLAVMANGLGAFFSILESENVDLSDPSSLAAPGVVEALEDAADIFESADFQKASEDVSAWFDSMCAEVNS